VSAAGELIRPNTRGIFRDLMTDSTFNEISRAFTPASGSSPGVRRRWADCWADCSASGSGCPAPWPSPLWA